MTTTTTAPSRIRLPFDDLAPTYAAAVESLDAAATHEADRVGLPPALRELVRLRASQINGCTYCVDLHSRAARSAGAGGQRVDALAVWRESALFTPAERAALDLTEHVTRMSAAGVPDGVVATAVEQLGAGPAAALLAVVATITVWNAIGVTTRCWATPPRADA
jgi:AhpD family alkylhydroperoxidase